MKTIPKLLTAVAAACLCGVTGLAVAQDKKPVELRYTSGAPPSGNPWATQINRMAKDVEEESKGEFKLQPFFASSLGSEQDTVQQVARGRIDMGGSSGSAALLVPEIGLLVMPFYFKNTVEMDCVLDNHMTPMVTDLFAKKGVQFLGWAEVGTIDYFGKKAYTSPKDMNGVKAIGYANKTSAMSNAALGANAIPLGLPEWIPALQTGLAEVVASPITLALPSGPDQSGHRGNPHRAVQLGLADADQQGRLRQTGQSPARDAATCGGAQPGGQNAGRGAWF